MIDMKFALIIPFFALIIQDAHSGPVMKKRREIASLNPSSQESKCVRTCGAHLFGVIEDNVCVCKRQMPKEQEEPSAGIYYIKSK